MKYNPTKTYVDMVEESLIEYSRQPSHLPSFSDGMTDEQNRQIEYLRQHLTPSTFVHLEKNNFFINKPFPHHEASNNWIDEAEIEGESNVVEDSIVQQDTEAWKHVM